MPKRILLLAALAVLAALYVLIDCVMKFQNNICWPGFWGCK